VADDFTVQVINEFVALTGAVGPTLADYGQAMEWETMGMPIEVVLWDCQEFCVRGLA